MGGKVLERFGTSSFKVSQIYNKRNLPEDTGRVARFRVWEPRTKTSPFLSNAYLKAKHLGPQKETKGLLHISGAHQVSYSLNSEYPPYLEGQGDSVSRLIREISRITIWAVGVINLLTKSA